MARQRVVLLASTALSLATALPPVLPAAAQDATWLANPGTGNFNTGSNWSTGTVPTGTAFFDASSTTGLTISGLTSLDGWTFNAGASAYTFTTNQSLEFNGAGIDIQGGSASITTNGFLSFNNSSTAGSANITNDNILNFNSTSTAGSAAISNNGTLNVFSTADSATITNAGTTQFRVTGTAGSATIANSGNLYFQDTSTAGNATITTSSGGTIFFQNSSTGGDARFITDTGGTVDMSLLSVSGMTAGSIAGAGSYNLGAKALTVGSNDLSTEVSGATSGAGGSLVKTGAGTLTLTSANTYTGGTTISQGTLQLGAGSSTGSIVGAVTVGASGTFEVTNADTSGITSITNANFTNFNNSTSAGDAAISNNGGGVLNFNNASTAGNATIVTDLGTFLKFNDSSTAGNATILANGAVEFRDVSTAGSATITNNSDMSFWNSSGAGNADITNNNTLFFADAAKAGTAVITNANSALLSFLASSAAESSRIANAGTLDFNGTSTAGGAEITNSGAGTVVFNGLSSAGNATITLAADNTGSLTFTNLSTAGNATIVSDSNATSIAFNGTSTAGTARITSNGLIEFNSFSTADNATIISNGALRFTIVSSASSADITSNADLQFFDSSTAGSAAITNNGLLNFNDNSTAGSAAITNNGLLNFNDNSTAGNAAITNNILLTFFDGSTAGSADITNNFSLSFWDGTAGNATITNNSNLQFINAGTGGDAAIINNAGGLVDLSGARGTNGDRKVSAGSIAGAGRYNLDANELTVGSNNLSTEVSGAISGAGGSLVKTGTGTLTLSGANTYTNGTTVKSGTLVAAHADGTGRIDALGSGPVALDGGALRTDVTGYLATDLGFAAGKTSVLAARTGTTLTIGGDPGDPSATGNLPARIIMDANAVAQFGTATDTGTIQIGASSTISFFDIDPTASVIVAGGTLKDFQDQLVNIVASASSTTVMAGATIDFNDSNAQAILNLKGAGNVVTGTTAGGPLQLGLLGSTPNLFSGVISGAHGVFLTALGPSGTMIFAGDNTYTGGTTICFCTTLQLGDGGTTGSVVGDIANGGTLVFNRSNTYSFAGVISDDFGDVGTVIQAGTGKTVLTNTHTYTGGTFVNGGTLQVDGSIASSALTTVNSGGTLGGNGTVGSTTINNGGNLAPGSSIGTLTVNGNLTFNNGSTYTVEVSPSVADRTNVTGQANLDGTVEAIALPGSFTGKTYTILHADGGILGTFTGGTGGLNVTGSFSPARNPHLDYDLVNNDVLLIIDPGTITVSSDFTGNQTAVANAINTAVGGGGTPPPGFDALLNLTPAALLNALNQVSGEVGAGTTQVSFNAMNLFINLLLDPFTGHNGGSGGALGFAAEDDLPAAVRQAYAAVTPRDATPAGSFERRWGVWASAYGGSSTVNGDASTGSHDVTSSIYGMAVGADYLASPDTRLGFAMAGAGYNAGLSGVSGHSRAGLFQAAVYGRHRIGNAGYVAGVLAYGWQEVTTSRTVTVAGTDKLEATFHPQTFSARGEAGHRFATPWLGVTPYGALQATVFVLPSYGEHATAGSNQFALSYDAQTVTNWRTELGVRLDKSFAVEEGLLTLRHRLAWAHDSNTDRPVTATFQTLPGASFTVNGAAPAADSLLVSAMAEMRWRNGWSLAASFDGEFSDTTRSYAGKGTLRYEW